MVQIKHQKTLAVLGTLCLTIAGSLGIAEPANAHIPAESGQLRVSFSPTGTGRAVTKSNNAVPDVDLRRCLSYYVGNTSDPEADITAAQMRDLRNGVSCWGYGIRSLEGLEYAVDLTRLDLEENQITDVSP